MKLPVAPSATRRPRTGLVSLLSILAVLIGLAAFTQPAAAGPDGPTTYADQSYASTVARPSEDKPQSKLWYNDGSWWALMVAAPSIGTTAPNALLVGVFSVAKTAGVTPPVGMTERTEVRSSTGQVTGETADQLRPSPGTTGTRVATSSVAGPNIGQLVALNPGS